MNNTIFFSTFVLTLLLIVGLFFFIKASIKERIEKLEMIPSDSPELLLEQLQAYFQSRAYALADVEPDQQKLVFQGYVRPSWFLAIFLSFLAAIGLACLGLVFSYLYPESGFGFLTISVLSPLAGFFYWKGAARLEKVTLQVQEEQKFTLTGHRDELASLKQCFFSQVVKEA